MNDVNNGVTPDFSLTDMFDQMAFYSHMHRGKRIGIKVSGKVVDDEHAMAGILEQAVNLKLLGGSPFIISGGGRQTSKALEDAGIKSGFTKAGLRISDADTMRVMTPLMDKLVFDMAEIMRADIAAREKKLGIPIDITPVPMGGYQSLVGFNSSLVRAERDPDPEMGMHNGIIASVHRRQAEALISGGNIPIIHPICKSSQGEENNNNADPFAIEISKALGAKRLIFASDIDGVFDEHGKVISELFINTVPDYIARGVFKDGMVVKAEAAVNAVRAGIEAVTMLNGTKPHTIVEELFTTKGVGTQFRERIDLQI